MNRHLFASSIEVAGTFLLSGPAEESGKLLPSVFVQSRHYTMGTVPDATLTQYTAALFIAQVRITRGITIFSCEIPGEKK